MCGGVFLIRFETSAKGVAAPRWQAELGLGVAAAVKSGLELNLFMRRKLWTLGVFFFLK